MPSSPPPFFRPADLRRFQQRLRTTPRYNNQLPADRQVAERLKAGIFAPTAYWVHQVASRLPIPVHYTVRQQWEQGHYFRRYSWGRIGLADYQDKGFYITLGVDSGETERGQALVAQGLIPPGPALILKVDVHTAPDSNLAPEERQIGRAAVDGLPISSRWKRIGLEELPAYSWSRLIEESVEFITQHASVLHQLWSGKKKVRSPFAQLKPGRTAPLKLGKVPVDIAERETELGDEHRRLSNLLFDLLPNYGYSSIAHSCAIEYGLGKAPNEIDMVATNAQGHIAFFELKALSSVDKCLREAMGQLLEYAYWEAPIPSSAARLFIATAHPLTPPARRYLQRLKAEFNLPLGYVQIEAKNEQLYFFEA
jgi:hypothetical protein